MLEDAVVLAAVTLLSVLEQVYFSLQVIHVRRKYSVSPPNTSGAPEFERVFRAQVTPPTGHAVLLLLFNGLPMSRVNCSEYFPLFITLLWTAGLFFSQGLSCVCGLLYLYGRFRYFHGYSQSSQGRLAPLYFSAWVLWLLIGFSCVGVVLSFFRVYLGVDLLQEAGSALHLL